MHVFNQKVFVFLLFLFQKHRLWVLIRSALSKEDPQSIFWWRNKKKMSEYPSYLHLWYLLGNAKTVRAFAQSGDSNRCPFFLFIYLFIYFYFFFIIIFFFFFFFFAIWRHWELRKEKGEGPDKTLVTSRSPHSRLFIRYLLTANVGKSKNK